jgi:hypothetical protein
VRTSRGSGPCVQACPLLYRSYTESSSAIKPQPPEYDDDYRTQDVFADKYFYYGREDVAEFFAAKREAVFGQMPLHEAASKWNTPEKQADLAQMIGATQSVVIGFMRRSPIEHRLRGRMLAVNEGQELKLIRDGHWHIPSISDQMKPSHLVQLDDRAKKIIYVTRPFSR